MKPEVLEKNWIDKKTFEDKGFLVIDNFLPENVCDEIVDSLKKIESESGFIRVDRVGRRSTSRFSTINGEELECAIPAVAKIYKNVGDLVKRDISNELKLIENRAIGVSINITAANQQFAMHYDRNAITIVLYLTEVESGGEMEFYPNQRMILRLPSSSIVRKIQKVLDLLSRTSLLRTLRCQRKLVTPKKGRMLLFKGNQCLHGVRPVLGSQKRCSLQLAYDSGENDFCSKKTTDYYGYRKVA